MTFSYGEETNLSCEWNNHGLYSVIVRVLKKRFLPLDHFMAFEEEYIEPYVVLKVGGKSFYVDKIYVSSISPFFDQMFHGGFSESRKKEAELSKLDSNTFRDFLFATMSDNRVLPNPANVKALIELADKYNVKRLMDDCERHLKCSGLPASQILLLADKHNLKDLQLHMMGLLNDEDWGELMQRDRATMELLSPDFYKRMFPRPVHEW